MKRILIALLVLLLVAGTGLALYARRVLTGDNVRAAVAAQFSGALGQPVTIGGLGASVYPRVTMDLTDVTIGRPARVHLSSVHLGTGLRALFSRRIEGANVRVDGATITLPLPDFTAAAPAGHQPGARSSPVEIVSIDEIVLQNVEVFSGGRTLRGDIELVPQGDGVQIRRVALAADDARLEMTGALTSLAPVEGHIDATADALDLDRLLAFLTDFTASAGPGAPSGAAPAASPVTTGVDGRLTFVLTTGRATTGGLVLSDLEATAVVLPGSVSFEPLKFGVFSGRYDGSMRVVLSGTPRFDWRGAVSGIDTAALMAFAGSPAAITGRLGGTVALEGTGLEMERALRTARGTARVDITDGTIAGLALVRTVVTAGSGRGGVLASAGSALGARSDPGSAERFSRLGATLAIAGGRMHTTDLAMSSTDLDLLAAGSLGLTSMTADFAGRVQLSRELSKEAGTDLYRLAQEDGRVTLPVAVSGPMGNLSVRVGVADAATRALRNRAAEEAKKAIERNIPKGLRGLFKKGGGG